MNLGQAKERVIDLIRERSNAGTLISVSRNQDYYLTMNSHFNEAQMQIATTQKKINDNFFFTQDDFNSVTGSDGFTLKKHTPGTDDSIEVVGALAYYLEANKTHTVKVEEETAPGVWTELESLDGLSATGVGFTAYKGLIVASDPANKVRLRFTGLYTYNYRNVAMYTDSFAVLDDVPEYTQVRFYPVPANFYQLQEIAFSHDYMKYDLYGNYKYADKPDKGIVIGVPYYEIGEFEVRYYRYPTAIPIDYDDPTLYDSMEFDVDDEAVEVMLLYVASKVKIDEDPYLSSKFEQEYYIKLNSISNKENQGLETVTDINGWV